MKRLIYLLLVGLLFGCGSAEEQTDSDSWACASSFCARYKAFMGHMPNALVRKYAYKKGVCNLESKAMAARFESEAKKAFQNSSLQLSRAYPRTRGN